MKYLLIIGVCVFAACLGYWWPVPGGPVFAMLLGVVMAPWAERLELVSVCRKISRRALLGSVVLLGLGLDIGATANLDTRAWLYMVATVAFGLLATFALARLVGLHGPVALLVAVGTSICGGSAIAAVAGVAQAREQETAQALSTIFFYNILAAILFPLAGHVLNMDDQRFGYWAGTAINDTSSVLAAAFAFGGTAGAVGMTVKMARTLMILPVSLGVAWTMRRQGKTTGSWKKVLPLPAIGFGAALLVRFAFGTGAEPVWYVANLCGHGLMILALACIGLASPLDKLWRDGRRALAAGGLGWIALACFAFKAGS